MYNAAPEFNRTNMEEAKEKKRKINPLLMRYLVSIGVCALMAVGVMAIRGLFSGEEMSLYDTYKALCDGFFVSGILMLCFGCLVFVAQEGAFDALRFMGHSLIGLFKTRRPGEKRETYADYKEKLAEKGKGKFFYMIIVGAAFIAVAAVFLLLSENM